MNNHVYKIWPTLLLCIIINCLPLSSVVTMASYDIELNENEIDSRNASTDTKNEEERKQQEAQQKEQQERSTNPTTKNTDSSQTTSKKSSSSGQSSSGVSLAEGFKNRSAQEVKNQSGNVDQNPSGEMIKNPGLDTFQKNNNVILDKKFTDQLNSDQAKQVIDAYNALSDQYQKDQFIKNLNNLAELGSTPEKIITAATLDAQQARAPEQSTVSKYWNKAVRLWKSFGSEKEYVKTVVKQALNGDLDSSMLLKSKDISEKLDKLSFAEKREIIKTAQNEANKVFQKAVADPYDIENKSPEEKKLLEAKQQENFEKAYNTLVTSLKPMLFSTQEIFTTWDKNNNKVIIQLVDFNKNYFDPTAKMDTEMDKLIKGQNLVDTEAFRTELKQAMINYYGNEKLGDIFYRIKNLYSDVNPFKIDNLLTEDKKLNMSTLDSFAKRIADVTESWNPTMKKWLSENIEKQLKTQYRLNNMALTASETTLDSVNDFFYQVVDPTTSAEVKNKNKQQNPVITELSSIIAKKVKQALNLK